MRLTFFEMDDFRKKQGDYVMMKKITTVFLTTALSSVLYAGNITNSEKIIGLEIGAATIQADTGGFFAELDHEGTDMELGIRLGAQFDSWRTMLVFDYFDSSDDDQNYEKGLITVDYFLSNDTAAMRPYLGVNAGYMNYESTDIDESGFLYGVQTGFTYRVMPNVDVDLSYRYSFTDAGHTDHIQSALLGINYIY